MPLRMYDVIGATVVNQFLETIRSSVFENIDIIKFVVKEVAKRVD